MKPLSEPSQAVDRDQTPTELPKGLFRRGKFIWISKRIDGKRHQLSTGTADVAVAQQKLKELLEIHGVMPKRKSASSRPPLPRGLYWKGEVIWVSRGVEGEHFNFSTGTSDPTQAEQILADFNLKSFKGEKLGVVTRPRVTFDDLASRCLEQGKLNGLRIRTLQRYGSVKEHFLEFLQTHGLENTDIKKLTPATIEDYKTWRSSTPLNRNGRPVLEGEEADSDGASPKTLQFEVQTFGMFFKHGVRLGVLAENPVSRVQSVRLSKKAPVYLEVNEAHKLLKAAATYDKWAGARDCFGDFLQDVILTFLKTGMRLQELRHLEWSDVNFRRHEITIQQEKDVESLRTLPLNGKAAVAIAELGPAEFNSLPAEAKQNMLGPSILTIAEAGSLKHRDVDMESGLIAVSTIVEWKPKTSGRVIPISPQLAPVLKRQPRKDNLVFSDPRTGGLWSFKINRVVKRCAEHAGIKKDIHTHSLRHSFATQLRKQGVPLETIKELLGHSDLRDTLIYAQFSPAEAKRAIEKIDVI